MENAAGRSRPASVAAARRHPLTPLLRATGAALAAFVRARDGGPMLVAGLFLIGLVMLPAGGAMSNYAWREAQWEELRAAGRAAVAAAGPLLAGVQQGVVAPVQERAAAFMNALVPGMNVEAADVGVAYDADQDATTVTIRGAYDFDDIWLPWGDDDDAVTVVVTARLEQERYEIAATLDISGSMSGRFRGDGGSRVVKLDALKAAMKAAEDALADAAASGKGSMMVSVVPFTSMVKVADTCNADEHGDCQAAKSAGKERYVRMLAGVRDTMALTLDDARAARAAGQGGHWVDSFHSYGAGTGLGPLRRQFLPEDLLANRDWDLRRTDVDIDVSAQIPGLRTWQVDDEDFWSGCVMARWGAYWDPAARPAGWDQTDPDNWPAAKAVAPWTAASAGLPAATPLHLSDAPPAGTDPNSLFTAYSWPDARVSGNADHLLQGAMHEMFDPNSQTTPYATGSPIDFVDYETAADNDWSLPTRAGGGVNCPRNPITPLTQDAGELRTAVADLTVLPDAEVYHYADRRGFSRSGSTRSTMVRGTYLHLGIVWGLRTLSPLWRGVWNVADAGGIARPAAPCAENETAGCQRGIVKSILIITDGTVSAGSGAVSRLGERDANMNAHWYTHLCGARDRYNYAIYQQTPAGFNGRFKTPAAPDDWVDSTGRLNAAGIERFAEAYLRMAGSSGDDARRATLIDTLENAAGTGQAPTPWQLFRGRDAALVDVLVGPGSGFDMSGRPVLIDDRCRRLSMFGSYGRIDDLVYVGDVGEDASTPPVPVAAAPFTDEYGKQRYHSFIDDMEDRLEDWFVQSCELAGRRRVRVNAVYMGPTHQPATDLLERCVDAAGGSPDRQDVFITPDAAELTSAMNQIFTHRRNLRFLD